MTSSKDVGDQLALVAQGGLACVAVERPLRPARRPRRDERGMVSAEWAVGIIAAIAIAGVLLTVVTSGPVEKGFLAFILLVIHSFSAGL